MALAGTPAVCVALPGSPGKDAVALGAETVPMFHAAPKLRPEAEADRLPNGWPLWGVYLQTSSSPVLWEATQYSWPQNQPGLKAA